MNENSRTNLRYAVTKCVVLLLVAWLAGLSGTRAHGQVATWTGAGADDSWSTEENWDLDPPVVVPVLPGPDDVAEFNETDSPGTSIVDMDFTIAGLQYGGNSQHLLDLYGFNLQVDEFVHVGVGNSMNGATVTWTSSLTGGNVTIGNIGAPGTFYVGVNNSGTTGATVGSLSLDGITVNALVDDLSIGRKASMHGSGTADGSLTLGSHSILHVGTAAAPAVVNIGMNQSTAEYPYGGYGDAVGVLDATDGTADFHLSELNVGRRTWGLGDGTATGTLRWNQPGVLYAEDVYFGRGGYTTGILEVPEGGTFLLGDEDNPVSLLGISYNDTSGSGTSTAHLNLRVPGIDPTFVAYIGANLSIGRRTGGGGGAADGSLTLGENSHLYVGTTASPAVVNIGMNGNGSTGLLDATQGEVVFHLDQLNVGRHSGSTGTATGTLRWNQTTAIDAESIYLGRGPSTGVLEVPAGGHIQLGTAADPVSLLAISYHDTGSPGASNAHLDLTTTDPFFEAFVGGDLSIGRKASMHGSGTADGSLTLGSHSILHVGTAAAPAVVNIGMNQSTAEYPYGGYGDAVGVLDATDGTADFHLSELNVGYNKWDSGTATGTLTTGSGSAITATTVNVAKGKHSTGTVNLAGGLLAAETINMGSGGTFNFTNGRLGIGTFNTFGPDGSLDQQGGTLAPAFSPFDTSLAGIATINGGYRLASGGTLEIELFGLTPGTEYDQLFVNGIVNLNSNSGDGGILDVVLGFAPEIGDEFIILDNDETDWISGTFLGLPEGAEFFEEYQGLLYEFSITYRGFSGNDNDVVLTNIGVVPVPGASVLAGVGLLTSMWLCRRKKINKKGR